MYFFSIALLVLIKESKNDSRVLELKKGSVILAFGDSLTNGFGVKREFSYPMQIQKKTAVTVINAGIDGELSSEGLKTFTSILGAQARFSYFMSWGK